MRTIATFASLIFLVPGCRSASNSTPAKPTPATGANDAFAVLDASNRLAERDLWPHFELQTIPVAIYDGERTLLFRHPSPPQEFVPVPDHQHVVVFTGRYPRVTANSSADIGGVHTATLMPASERSNATARAGILVHEAFHVFQRVRHPRWSANEGELFTYPVDSAPLLTLRRQETAAIRRALQARDATASACWSRTAMSVRAERMAALPPAAAAYERHTELNEGLATYVERRAVGASDRAILPDTAFAPDAVRQRAYLTGTALGRLLDRFDPRWRNAMEDVDTVALDIQLTNALQSSGRASGKACRFGAGEVESLRATAVADIDVLRNRRLQQRRTFLDQPGWTLVVMAGDTPLFPQGFDPLNVDMVAPGEVLHKRFVKLGNDAGDIEVLGHASLSVAAGAHPLFNGVRSLTLTGLTNEPTVMQVNGVTTVHGDGITLTMRGAVVDHREHTISVRLSPSR